MHLKVGRVVARLMHSLAAAEGNKVVQNALQNKNLLPSLCSGTHKHALEANGGHRRRHCQCGRVPMKTKKPLGRGGAAESGKLQA